MGFGDLRQRLTGELGAQLLRRNPDRAGSSIQLEAEASAARAATVTAGTWKALATRGQTGVGARLTDRRFERSARDVEALGQSVDELLIARLCLASSWSGRLRLSRGYADRGAAQNSDRAQGNQAATN